MLGKHQPGLNQPGLISRDYEEAPISVLCRHEIDTSYLTHIAIAWVLGYWPITWCAYHLRAHRHATSASILKRLYPGASQSASIPKALNFKPLLSLKRCYQQSALMAEGQRATAFRRQPPLTPPGPDSPKAYWKHDRYYRRPSNAAGARGCVPQAQPNDRHQ